MCALKKSYFCESEISFYKELGKHKDKKVGYVVVYEFLMSKIRGFDDPIYIPVEIMSLDDIDQFRVNSSVSNGKFIIYADLKSDNRKWRRVFNRVFESERGALDYVNKLFTEIFNYNGVCTDVFGPKMARLLVDTLEGWGVNFDLPLWLVKLAIQVHQKQIEDNRHWFEKSENYLSEKINRYRKKL